MQGKNHMIKLHVKKKTNHHSEQLQREMSNKTCADVKFRKIVLAVANRYQPKGSMV